MRGFRSVVTIEQRVGRGVRIAFARRPSSRRARRTPSPAATPRPRRRAAARRRSRGSRPRSRSRRRVASSPFASRCARCARDRVPQLVDAVARRRDRADDRRPPRRARRRARACLRDRARSSAAPGPVGLVHDEDVGDLEQPGLRGLHRVAPPGFTTTTVVSAWPAISTSTWPTPTVSITIHGLPTASSTRTACGVASARPPRCPRRRHRPDEHAGVGRRGPACARGRRGSRRR